MRVDRIEALALGAAAARTTGSMARYSSHGASDMPSFGITG